ncbi:MAG: citryl-CoA lyase [Pseudomonadota bacterium]
MDSEQKREMIATQIWLEEPEPNNPFTTRIAYCRGYDVYGEMLGRSRWVDMIYLLFRDEPPSPAQAQLLETLAVALANPGPRDPSVHAAMCGGVGGSTAASCLIAALAVGAGQLGGGREVFLMMEDWYACGIDLDLWRSRLATPTANVTTVWPESDHRPGFDPHGMTTAMIVTQTLACLTKLFHGTHLSWLEANRNILEMAVERPLALSGIAATAFVDLGLTPDQGEMLYLMLRLPGAAAHALEQRSYGHKKFPFFSVELENDPEMELP